MSLNILCVVLFYKYVYITHISISAPAHALIISCRILRSITVLYAMLSRSIMASKPAGKAISILRSPSFRVYASQLTWHFRSIATQGQPLASKRHLSGTALLQKDQKEFFPALPTSVAPKIEQTETAWKHPM
jgi:hypothetical protein